MIGLKRGENVFLMNDWQQYGDGRKRTRNGLLSEKLTTSEILLLVSLVFVLPNNDTLPFGHQDNLN